MSNVSLSEANIGQISDHKTLEVSHVSEAQNLNSSFSVDTTPSNTVGASTASISEISSISKLITDKVTSYVAVTDDRINLTFSFPKSDFGIMSLNILKQLDLTHFDISEIIKESESNDLQVSTPNGLEKSASSQKTVKSGLNRSFLSEITQSCDINNSEEILKSYLKENYPEKEKSPDKCKFPNENGLELGSYVKSSITAAGYQDHQDLKSSGEATGRDAETAGNEQNVVSNGTELTKNMSLNFGKSTSIAEERSSEFLDPNISVPTRSNQGMNECTSDYETDCNGNMLASNVSTQAKMGVELRTNEDSYVSISRANKKGYTANRNINEEDVSTDSLKDVTNNDGLSIDRVIENNSEPLKSNKIVTDGSVITKLNLSYLTNELNQKENLDERKSNEIETTENSLKLDSVTKEIKASFEEITEDVTDRNVNSGDEQNLSEKQNISAITDAKSNDVWPAIPPFTEIITVPVEEFKPNILADTTTKYFQLKLPGKCIVIKAVSKEMEISLKVAEYKKPNLINTEMPEENTTNKNEATKALSINNENGISASSLTASEVQNDMNSKESGDSNLVGTCKVPFKEPSEFYSMFQQLSVLELNQNNQESANRKSTVNLYDTNREPKENLSIEMNNRKTSGESFNTNTAEIKNSLPLQSATSNESDIEPLSKLVIESEPKTEISFPRREKSDVHESHSIENLAIVKVENMSPEMPSPRINDNLRITQHLSLVSEEFIDEGIASATRSSEVIREEITSMDEVKDISYSSSGSVIKTDASVAPSSPAVKEEDTVVAPSSPVVEEEDVAALSFPEDDEETLTDVSSLILEEKDTADEKETPATTSSFTVDEEDAVEDKDYLEKSTHDSVGTVTEEEDLALSPSLSITEEDSQHPLSPSVSEKKAASLLSHAVTEVDVPVASSAPAVEQKVPAVPSSPAGEEEGALIVPTVPAEEEEAPAVPSSPAVEEEEAPAISSTTAVEEKNAQVISSFSTVEEEDAPVSSSSLTIEEEDAPVSSSPHTVEEDAPVSSPSLTVEEEDVSIATTAPVVEEKEALAVPSSPAFEKENASVSSSLAVEQEDASIVPMSPAMKAEEIRTTPPSSSLEEEDAAPSSPVFGEDNVYSVLSPVIEREIKSNDPSSPVGDYEEEVLSVPPSPEVTRPEVERNEDPDDSSCHEDNESESIVDFETLEVVESEDYACPSSPCTSKNEDTARHTEFDEFESKSFDNLEIDSVKSSDCSEISLQDDSITSNDVADGLSSVGISSNNSTKKLSRKMSAEENSIKKDHGKSQKTQSESGVKSKRVGKKAKSQIDEVDSAPTRVRSKNQSSKLSKESIPEHSVSKFDKIRTRVGSSIGKASPMKRSMRSNSLDPSPTKIPSTSKPSLDKRCDSFANKTPSVVPENEAHKRIKQIETPLRKDIKVAARSSPRKTSKATAASTVRGEAKDIPKPSKTSNESSSDDHSSKARSSMDTSKSAVRTRSKRGVKD